MCGIAGFFDPSGKGSATILAKMTKRIQHRGPDGGGEWIDKKSGLFLGHRRLSILDLSPAGNQPMVSSSGRYVLAYNGEIYNHPAIRNELNQGSPKKWNGHSDTEVVLEAFETWGIEKAVERFVGMFAMALWDKKDHCLFLLRDRLGEKPMYYGVIGNLLLFGSELKSFTRHPAFRGEIDHDSLALYVRYGYVPAPRTIYTSVFKVAPGTFRRFLLKKDKNISQQEVAYWSAHKIATQGLEQPFQGNEEEAVLGLEKILQRTVREQMQADVPVGVFLSGGIDSSLVTALMQGQSHKPVRTFTIGSFEKQYDESKEANEVARHLGTLHSELHVSAQEAIAVIPQLSRVYDEPFGDSSQIATHLVAKMARQHVKVGLTGDGGDESFGGYNRHVWAKKIWEWIGWLPPTARGSLSSLLYAKNPRRIDQYAKTLGAWLPKSFRHRLAGDKIHKIAGILACKDKAEVYRYLCSAWPNPSLVMKNPPGLLTSAASHAPWLPTNNFSAQMMFLDLTSYLPDDILVKVDRASMAVSLETRAPLLDHRIVEYAWKLPIHQKIKNLKGKEVLRKILEKYVPKNLIDRPKMGFAVPIHAWLRGPLKPWATELLNETKILKNNFFNPEPIQIMWKEHLSGRRNHQHALWHILMFQAWHEENC